MGKDAANGMRHFFGTLLIGRGGVEDNTHFTAVFMDKIVCHPCHSTTLVEVEQALEPVANTGRCEECIEPGTDKFVRSIARHFEKGVIRKDKTSVFIQDKARGRQSLNPNKGHGLQKTSLF